MSAAVDRDRLQRTRLEQHKGGERGGGRGATCSLVGNHRWNLARRSASS